jgi:UDP-N-acetylmuramyl pentapeptide phosphotransferase/UDP-N-acetylglucosamine-1-phosphate transferase
MFLYKMSTLAAFVVTAVWAINKPAYDSIAAAVVAFAAVILVFFVDDRRKSSGQTQDVGAGGIGIQAGRDANNNRINKNK